jgi:hypothetical protein
MKIPRWLTRCVATLVAMVVAGQPAWGHVFPPVRTVVVQVERCEIAVLVGYRPAGGEATDTILARIASQPKSQMLVTAKHVLAKEALGPLTFALGGKALVPTSVRAKIGVDPGGTKPLVVLLVTFSIPSSGALTVTSKDARNTRISWADRDSGRIDLDQAPAQGRWFTGVASFLLSVAPLRGDSACAISRRSSP